MSEPKVSVFLKSIMRDYSISNIHTGGHLIIKCQKQQQQQKKKKKIPKSIILSKFEQLH